MDPAFKGTVVETLYPLIEKDGAKILDSHGVSREQYVLWLYRRAYGTVGIQSVVVVVLCVTLFVFIVIAVAEHGDIAINGTSLIAIVGGFAVIAVILGLTSWTMRHSSNVLNSYMATLGFAHQTTPEYMRRISAPTWHHIATFEPDVDRLKTEKTVFRKAPDISAAQQEKMDRLSPARKVAGYATLLTLAWIFFVGESGMSMATALWLVALGVWFTIRSVQMRIAGQFTDRRYGQTVYGMPAKVLSTFSVGFSVAIVILGIFGLVFSLGV